MRILIFLFSIVAFSDIMAQSLPKSGKAQSTGSCSLANSGLIDKVDIRCGIDAEQGRKMIEILNKILATHLDTKIVTADLDKLAVENSKLLSYGSPTHGVLLPGNEPDPPLSSGCKPPPDALKIFIGSFVAWTQGPWITAFQTSTGDYAQVDRTGPGITVSAVSTHFPDGKVVVKIANNEFIANANNTLDRKISDDHTSLEVTDEYNQQAFGVRFLNSHSVRLTGTFSTRDGPLTIERDKIKAPGNNTFTGGCSGNGLVGFLF